jgi:hypothetical protein
MRCRLAAQALLTGGLVVVAAAGATSAGPRIAVELGVTGAVADLAERHGLSSSLTSLWSVHPHFDFGVMLFADDLGTDIERLQDPNDGTDLGAVGRDHGFLYGGAWRADYSIPGPGSWTSYVSTTWGYYRLQTDQLGVVTAATSATGVSLGAGIAHSIARQVAVGASFRFHHLFADRLDYYGRAAVDLIWRTQ